MGYKEKAEGSKRKKERKQEELSSADLVIFINKLSLLFLTSAPVLSHTLFSLSFSPLCFSKLLVFTASVHVLNY